MSDISYTEILTKNKDFRQTLSDHSYNIAILSNITIDLIKEILEYFLRIEGIDAEVQIGNYDNIVQDSIRYRDANLVIVFWEVCNLTDSFHTRAELLENSELDALVAKTEAEIDLVLRNLSTSSLVLFNKFTADIFTYTHPGDLALEGVTSRLNNYLERRAQKNVRLINTRRVLLDIGVGNCIDIRSFYASKSLYKVNFFKGYARHIRPMLLAANGKSKKALIFDCDNTLWKGIVGEDGPNGIEMSSATPAGAVYAEIQRIAKWLSKEGVLIGLCSRNNPDDVSEVLRCHPDMQLREQDLVIKKVNWSDKISNLREIARQLNIGLDSIVFIDDSSFEVDMIRQHLPEVLTLQVPPKVHEYPSMLRAHLPLFYTLSKVKEDQQRTEMYKQQETRETLRREYGSLDEYLASLGQRLHIFTNDQSLATRMAQMCQKTNQFNLTTTRYTEGDIRRFIGDRDKFTIAFSLEDRLGDSGVTGLAILYVDQYLPKADIDMFLMSCRVIGRKIEYALMNYLVSSLQRLSIDHLTARYIATPKNELTRTFYESCGFTLVKETASTKEYLLTLAEYRPKQIDYIEVIHGK